MNCEITLLYQLIIIIILLIIGGFGTIFLEHHAEKFKLKMTPQDISALTVLIVAVIIAFGLFFGMVPPNIAAYFLIPFCGGKAITIIIKIRKGPKKS